MMPPVGMNNQNTISPVRPGRRRWVVLWVTLGVMSLLLLATISLVVFLLLQPRLTKLGSSGVDGNLLVSPEESDVTKVVNAVSPSVVSIMAAKGGFSGQQSAGTGMIISEDGYVLTNKHVVDAGRSFAVITSSGDRHTDVKLVGMDPLNDIAFLKINNVSKLPAASIGDSSTVRVGQKVIAIGNSLGQFQNTVTSGVISGKGRPLEAEDEDTGTSSLTDLLQTDAAINPGNSGGPLLNMSGQVIGINTAIVRDAQSIGFAIPIGAAKGLIRSVLEKGEIHKPYIGVRYVEITPEIKAEHKLSAANGAFVGGVSGRLIEQGGPADKAGVKSGDIITKVNDKTIGEHGGLGSLIGEYVPGETIRLTVLRGGQERQLTLTLGAYKS